VYKSLDVTGVLVYAKNITGKTAQGFDFESFALCMLALVYSHKEKRH